MIIGIKSFYEDGTPSVQLWDEETQSPIGEFEQGSPRIPKGCIICNTIGEFKTQMHIVGPWHIGGDCK